MLSQILRKLRSQGPRAVIGAVWNRISPARADCFESALSGLADTSGLEIGGPSGYFSSHGRFPVYRFAKRVDNCNFAHETLWEGTISEGDSPTLAARGVAGEQFVAEATQLGFLADERYDFVLSSNTLEHVANPIAALYEWTRVLKDGGLFVLVLPNRDGTFDHRRPVTTLAHLVADFEAGRGEDDLTHLDEILQLHDLRRDPGAGDSAAFASRARRNLENRALHHHVFDTRAAAALVDHVGLRILEIEPSLPYDILLVCRKESDRAPDANGRFLGLGASQAWRSPFPSDN